MINCSNPISSRQALGSAYMPLIFLYACPRKRRRWKFLYSTSVILRKRQGNLGRCLISVAACRSDFCKAALIWPKILSCLWKCLKTNFNSDLLRDRNHRTTPDSHDFCTLMALGHCCRRLIILHLCSIWLPRFPLSRPQNPIVQISSNCIMSADVLSVAAFRLHEGHNLVKPTRGVILPEY